MRQRELKTLAAQDVRHNGLPTLTRQWVEVVHPRLAPALPALAQKSLTTADLTTPDGRAADVYKTFGIMPSQLDSILGNYWGLSRSAQVSPGEGSYKKTWDGYYPIEVPVGDGVKLAARIARPTANDLGGSYIVIAHGLFGRHAGENMHNIADALRACGHHVVCVDMRGHGETARLHPETPFTFNLEEPRDLLAVSRWLRSTFRAQRVGLVGYSIGGHQALMAAWLDGNPSLGGRTDSPVVRTIAQPDLRPQFDAGIFVISPVLNMIDYANSLNSRRTILDSPVRAVFQGKCEERTREVSGRKSHKMWDLMEAELRRSRWIRYYPDYASLKRDNLRFIDFCELDGSHAGAQRMESVRVPVLVLQAGDDPLAGSAQAVANVFANVKNPNCGVVLLKEGGHGGFAALSPAYFYSLMKNFFDPATAPKSVDTYPDLVRRDTPRRDREGRDAGAGVPVVQTEPMKMTQ